MTQLLQNQAWLNTLPMLDEDLSLERQLFNVDDDDFDLFRAATLVGRVGEAGDIDLDAVAACTKDLAADVLRERESGKSGLDALVQTLFCPAGFAGDSEEYDAPKNSFLHRVSTRRRGSPIALSILTCEVARQAGLDAYGIAFPGHFLVGMTGDLDQTNRDLVVIDPFFQGRPRSSRDLEAHLKRMAGHRVELTPEHLAPAAPITILTRILNNLRGAYHRRGDLLGLARVLSRQLLLRPRDPWLLLARARARRLLLDDQGALHDVETAMLLTSDLRTHDAAQRLLSILADDRKSVH